MKAYAIFDGGGVLGAALAGALKAAQWKRVEFVGFGGTSAGSIVATLAAVGYSGEEIEEILIGTEFTSFLNDRGKPVEAFKSQLVTVVGGLDKGRLGAIGAGLRALLAYLGVGTLKQTLMSQFGVDDGRVLKIFMLKKITAKLAALTDATDINFADLAAFEDARDGMPRCYPLKIVASDVSRRRPVVFSKEERPYGSSVLEAVRASTCYPFVFQPVDLNRQCWLVDGGLASNLPAFLFHEEQQRTRYPVFAFDLTSDGGPAAATDYNLRRFLKDMVATALDAGDELLRKVLKDVIHVPIRIPGKFDVLDFGIGRDGRREFFDLGYHQTVEFLDRLEVLQRANEAEDLIDQLQRLGIGETEIRERIIQRQLQARYGEPKLFEAVLFAVAQDFETHTEAQDVRAHIMLRTGRSFDDRTPTRIVVYSYGMHDASTGEPHKDFTLELAEDGGCSGRAWSAKRPACANLELAAADPTRWKMTREQHRRVPDHRKSMLSVPIWHHAEAEKHPGSQPIGTLSIDSATPLADTYWLEENGISSAGPGPVFRSEVIERMLVWENVIRKLFA
jgi:NTE family protein